MAPDSSSAHKATLELILRKVNDLPSLPDVINKIVEKLNEPNASAADIANLISYDLGLTTKFLRIVNSSAYGFQRQISSVQHAIMIIGFTQVRGVVLSAGIIKMFQSSSPHGLDHGAFWQHSIRTALASRLLASHYKIRHSEDSFSAGLLHDVGKITLDTYFSTAYQQVLQATKAKGEIPHGSSFLRQEQIVLDSDHTEVGYLLAQRWRLPSALIEVVRYHHDPAQATDAPDLVYVVTLANAFSTLMQYNAGVFNSNRIAPDVLNYFQFDPENPDRFEALFHQIRDEMGDIDELIATLIR